MPEDQLLHEDLFWNRLLTVLERIEANTAEILRQIKPTGPGPAVKFVFAYAKIKKEASNAS